jgi:pyruvate/2-oxoglutarate/acetoin dehydrogenase E1 component
MGEKEFVMPIITPPEIEGESTHSKSHVTVYETTPGWWMVCAGVNSECVELHRSEVENLWKLVQERKADELQVEEPA